MVITKFFYKWKFSIQNLKVGFGWWNGIEYECVWDCKHRHDNKMVLDWKDNLFWIEKIRKIIFNDKKLFIKYLEYHNPNNYYN